MDYASKNIYDFKENITRYDHSLTVALLTWKCTKDKKATLAGLFQDIATPCFSHVIDYMNKDYENQESTEENTEKILKNDTYLNRCLKEDNIEIEDIIKNINNSDIVNVEIIGKSADKRNIYGIEIGTGKKVLYLDANVHAAEIANTLILTKFISEIVNNYESGDKETISLLKSVKLAIIPCMNPDGYEVYNFGVDSLNNKSLWMYQNKDNIDFENIKSNANGVDLNRNYPVQNAGLYFKGKKLLYNVLLKKSYSKTAYFGGEELGSEPETKASMYFMLKHYKNVYAYINLHSQGRVIYAGKPNLSNEFNKITSKFAKDIAKINKYTVYGLSSEEVGEGNDGSVTDFMAELANGFVMSSKTGRLSTDKHINNSCSLKYSYPVITIETIRTYTRNPEYFKDEYYNYGMRDALYSLLTWKYE